MQQGGIETICILKDQINHITRSLHQVVIPVAIPEMALATHQPQTSQDTSLSSSPISMVDNPHRIHKFLSPTFVCIQSRIHKFMSFTKFVFNESGDHILVQEESKVKSLQQLTKASSLATIPPQGDGLTNCTIIILRCTLYCKSPFLKSHFYFVVIIIIIFLPIYIYIYVHIYVYMYRKCFLKTF